MSALRGYAGAWRGSVRRRRERVCGTWSVLFSLILKANKKAAPRLPRCRPAATASRLGRFRLRFGLGKFARGQERLDESFLEIVAALEIGAAVLVGLFQEIAFDHVEDNFAEIFAGAHAPLVENGERHRAKLLQGVGAEAAQQFLSAHWPRFLLSAGHDLLLRVVERFLDKRVRGAVVTLVPLENLLEGLFEFDGLHADYRTTARPAGAGWANRQDFTAHPVNSKMLTTQMTSCCWRVRLSITLKNHSVYFSALCAGPQCPEI